MASASLDNPICDPSKMPIVMMPGRKMRQDDDDDDDAASMVSVETMRTNASEDAEFYDSYTKSEGEEETIEEAIEELTEKRYDHTTGTDKIPVARQVH